MIDNPMHFFIHQAYSNKELAHIHKKLRKISIITTIMLLHLFLKTGIFKIKIIAVPADRGSSSSSSYIVAEKSAEDAKNLVVIIITYRQKLIHSTRSLKKLKG